jgi:hypothetical protein
MSIDPDIQVGMAKGQHWQIARLTLKTVISMLFLILFCFPRGPESYGC